MRGQTAREQGSRQGALQGHTHQLSLVPPPGLTSVGSAPAPWSPTPNTTGLPQPLGHPRASGPLALRSPAPQERTVRTAGKRAPPIPVCLRACYRFCLSQEGAASVGPRWGQGWTTFQGVHIAQQASEHLLIVITPQFHI